MSYSTADIPLFNAGVDAAILIIVASAAKLAQKPSNNPFRRGQIVELLFALADELELAKLRPMDQQGSLSVGGGPRPRPIAPVAAEAVL